MTDRRIRLLTTIRNIVLWFSSLVLAVSLFSLMFGSSDFFFVFRITMIFALPVGLLYVPFVITLPDAEEGRIWTILTSGILIGPGCLAGLGLVLDLCGSPSHWEGDGMAPGLAMCVIFALIVGCFTTTFYVIALKLVHYQFAKIAHYVGAGSERGRVV